MTNNKQHLNLLLQKAIEEVYQLQFPSLEIQFTRKEFEGDYTLVVFPLIKTLKKKPEQIGQEIGEHLLAQKKIASYNVVKGFLNIELLPSTIVSYLSENAQNVSYGLQFPTEKSKTVMVEYSSPNTNKPLHLGHVRNNLLGYSVAEIIAASGANIVKTQIINDRGIHICKSMLAWEKFGNGETPESSKIKGDHLVGKYYVEFDKHYRDEIKELVANGMEEEEAKKKAPIFIEAQEMLRKWEANDPEVRALWEKMNNWVYDGFAKTYQRLGVDFDEYLYESDTYILGKDLVEEGLRNGVFYRKQDGSVWIDLTEDGLDEKLVLRADGTSVYITQDLGTAVERFKHRELDDLIYVVGNEQDYHFKVLFLILQKLGYSWAETLQHLSYGMVDLPEGKMKSREGTVVDADDLMQEIYETAKEIAQELGKLEGYTDAEKESLYEIIAMGALKYFILKVDPKKRILFDPKESVDFNGNTGPFVQYAYARIQSLLRKESPKDMDWSTIKLQGIEKELIRLLSDFGETIQKAAEELSPAIIANYTYDLVKLYNSFYQNTPILKTENETEKHFRLMLSLWVGNTIASGLKLLGIQVPERM
ncbi:arginine--tRNA ligase [Weeksella virosa]|uniref:Arginine--tRNA ligase n=1 Tax=Weeksella virosa (strain ATCC 43766 / DSM 16922 / JCM 21250 / CCUG 30538 / CDC 9751 / IAM 14551 / NBRC 16016 / NCTC 11634 / CL345/78) TaxID=865938 RepID=F0NZ06_WEEVC|nr:arginine--tRNA ligase [Weeksella virosa]ADX68223.1 Arginyl-tRNA synthetase [Weeksella virosa DSM 16922]MDK7674822.1 arginine--tRNA ligase [Weeksella virosa]VEH64140.1 Arginine--tRNA ligase [Weeksella virosa]